MTFWKKKNRPAFVFEDIEDMTENQILQILVWSVEEMTDTRDVTNYFLPDGNDTPVLINWFGFNIARKNEREFVQKRIV